MSRSRVVRFAAAIAAIVGLSVLFGWVLDFDWLRSGFGAGRAVHPWSALLFVLSAVSLWSANRQSGSLARQLGIGAAIAIVLAGVLVLAAPLLRLAPGFDLALVRGAVTALGDQAPRPMSSASAILFLMIGGSLLLVRDNRETSRLLGRALGIFILLLGLLAVAIYGYRLITGTETGRSGGQGTLVALFALAIGLSFAGSARARAAEEPSGNSTLGSEVGRVLIVAIGVLVLTGGLSIFSTIRSLTIESHRDQSYQRRLQLTRLFSALQAAESGMRGFVLTGGEEHLEPYHGVLADLPQELANPGPDSIQSRRLVALKPLITERLDQLTRVIQLRKDGQATGADSIIRSGLGRVLMMRIRDTIAVMTADEDSLAVRWSAQTRNAARLSFSTNLIAGVVALVFLVLAGLALRRDIRQRVSVEAERDRFFTLSLDMLCIANREGYFTRLNPAFSLTLGWTMEELLSRPYMELVHPDDRETTLSAVQEQLSAGQLIVGFENRYRHKNGSWRVLSWKAVPQPGGQIFATARDVTDIHADRAALRAAKESADAANRGKSDFLAKMSHELRTPLNSIIGFSEILEDQSVGPLTDKQRRYVGNVLVSGRNLLQLINDILDLSKVEAGRMELSLSTFPLGDALGQAREIVAPLAEKKGLTLALEAIPSMPLLRADPTRFKQIMFNLLSNAIKFTPPGGEVRIAARLVPGNQNGSGNGAGPRTVEVTVTDTGIGIAPEDRDRIFREFEQAGGTPRQHSEGTGLGLALTRKLVQLHGGEIWVESEPGKGSTFGFRLPGTTEATGSDPVPVSQGNGRIPGTHPLVLVVDDDSTSRDLIKHYLEQFGYRVKTTSTGIDAVQLAETVLPAVITLDIVLPDRDGLLVLAELKANPVTRHIPVVVVSVIDESELGFTLGAHQWLVKPVEREAFQRALDDATRAPRSSSNRTALVVDDDPSSVAYLAELLLQRGFAPLSAGNGREGVDLARRHLPDAIIMDLAMPVMNGFEAVHALQEDPKTRGIPILVVTGMDLTLSEREELLKGVQAIVTKGWRENLLAELAIICPVKETAEYPVMGLPA